MRNPLKALQQSMRRPKHPPEGGWVVTADTPHNDSWTSLLSWIGDSGVGPSELSGMAGAVGSNVMMAADNEVRQLQQEYPNEQIDGRMLAMMRAVEWFVDRSGDLWQSFVGPLDVGLSLPIVQHQDNTVRKLYEDYYFNRLDVPYFLDSIWLTTEQYGQAYPVIIVDKVANDRDPVGITLLNPKHVAIGRAIGTDTRHLAYLPPSDTKQALLQYTQRDTTTRLSERFFNSLMHDWNEWVVDRHAGFPLDPDLVAHVHHRKSHHMRYALPPAARALDDLSTRVVLDEMIRSTIEGVRTQWRLWRLEAPRFGELSDLTAKLRAGRPHKTADFIWDSRLQDPFVISPNSIDALLAPETWWRLTLSIYRKLGMFLVVVSGEEPSVGRGGTSNMEINIEILLARLNYQRRRTKEWLHKLNRVIAAANGVSELPNVMFEPPGLEWKSRLRELVPVLNYGMLSAQTFHSWIGLDHDTEISRLKQELPLREEGIISPYTGFAQSGPSGTAQSPASPGRPRGPAPETANQNARNAEGSAMNAARFVPGGYREETEAAWRKLTQYDTSGDTEQRVAQAEEFVAWIDALRAKRAEAYEAGYASAGGIRPMGDATTSEAYKHALRFDDENLEEFRKALIARAQSGLPWGDTNRNRAMMYVDAGSRQAYMDGVFEAQREHGFSAWRRVLRPHMSGRGPCETCIADTVMLHPITEPFWDHPNGVCDASMVLFSRAGDEGGLPLPFRVPSYT